MQQVLGLDIDVDPPSRRMEVRVPHAVRQAPVGRHGLLVGELAVLEPIQVEAAGILRVDAGFRLVAARRQQDGAVRGHEIDRVGIEAGVQLRPLLDPVADRPVGVEPMHGDGAGKAVGRQHVFAALVDGDVDGPVRQLRGVAERLQAARRIHPERVQVVVPPVAGRGALVAAGDVEVPARRMLPRLVHLLGQDQRPGLADQGVAVPADPVEAGAHGGIYGAASAPLGERRARC